jgi:4-alpha-glucanotransferase
MNVPGTARGNWEWRLEPDQLKKRAIHQLAELTHDYERAR